jgi:hypothetical protein
VELAEKRGDWKCWKKFADWRPRLGTRMNWAVAHYLDLIGDAQKAKPHVIDFMQAQRKMLEEDAELWGKVGYTLVASGAMKAAMDWLLPLYRRPDAEGWMLNNLSLALRENHQWERAAEVSTHVLNLGARDNTWGYHVATASLGHAIKGDYAFTNEVLKHAPGADLKPQDQFDVLTAEAMAQVLISQGPSAKARLKTYLREAKKLSEKHVVRDDSLEQHRLAVKRMAKHTGSWVMSWDYARGSTASESKMPWQQSSLFTPFIGLAIIRLLYELAKSWGLFEG